MTKQEIFEAFAPYLPYDVKGLVTYENKTFERELSLRNLAYLLDNLRTVKVKLILHPISEFIYNPEKYQEIRDNMSECEFESLRDSFVEFPCKNKLDHVSYSTVTFLIKNHFDVFGLIELGYAVDINTLNNGQI